MMNYQEWLDTVQQDFKADVLWKMTVYRYALFLGDLAWHDVTKLIKDRRTLGLSEQLYEAVGSISVNIAEGYSRRSGKDRARLYEYSLGSARESRDWYHKARHILGDEVVGYRQQFLTEIIRLLLTITPQERSRNIQEEQFEYNVDVNLDHLLRNAPLP